MATSQDLLIHNLYICLLTLVCYIEQSPDDNPLTWPLDRSVRVVDSPDFKMAKQTLEEAEALGFKTATTETSNVG